MKIAVDRNKVHGPVPALRGTYVGDSPEPIQEEDVARLKEDLGLTCIRNGFECIKESFKVQLTLIAPQQPVFISFSHVVMIFQETGAGPLFHIFQIAHGALVNNPLPGRNVPVQSIKS